MEIRIEHLNKKYGKQEVLKDINLTIPVGMYGLLGKNGAGKTTLMRILATISEATSGQVRINDIDIQNKKAIRNMIGYLPQEFSVYPSMSVYSALDYLGVLAELPAKRRRERVNSLLKQVNLEQEKHKKFKNLSGGMKRRFGIAQALLNDPKVLIVDEPTAGLDPEERIRFSNLLSELARDRIILLSTHIASDIEAVCSNVAILNHRNLIFQGSIPELLSEADGRVYEAELTQEELSVFKQRYKIIKMHQSGGKVLGRFLSDEPLDGKYVRCEPTVEDSYICLLKKCEGDEEDVISERIKENMF